MRLTFSIEKTLFPFANGISAFPQTWPFRWLCVILGLTMGVSHRLLGLLRSLSPPPTAPPPPPPDDRGRGHVSCSRPRTRLAWIEGLSDNGRCRDGEHRTVDHASTRPETQRDPDWLQSRILISELLEPLRLAYLLNAYLLRLKMEMLPDVLRNKC